MTDVLHYTDPLEGFRGWLAYDGRTAPLAAGGCRSLPGLDAATLSTLAGRMTLKQRVLGLNVDGAKCGIDYDPRSPGSSAALGRFLGFIRSDLDSRFSMGPDMGTQWPELRRLTAELGLLSPKHAVMNAQRLTQGEFETRTGLLEERLGAMTLGQRRAGHALAHAALAGARAAGTGGRISCALQGFGNLGRAAAYTLIQEGAVITAVADEHGCVFDPHGLDILDMLGKSQDTPVPALAPGRLRMGRDCVLHVSADVLILAGCADAMDEKETVDASFGAVAVGANCGLSEVAEQDLYARGVFVVPDFIGGIGGSASMETLFGPVKLPSAGQVLENLAHLMHQLVDDVAERARRAGCTARAAALDLAAEHTPDPAAPPYGQCRYLAA